MEQPSMDRCPGCLRPLAEVQGSRGWRYDCGSVWALQTSLDGVDDPVKILGITKKCRERAATNLSTLIEEAAKAIYRVTLLDPSLVSCETCKGMGVVRAAGTEPFVEAAVEEVQ